MCPIVDWVYNAIIADERGNSMSLKEKLEQIRINPRRYFNRHIEDFQDLDSKTYEELLALLFCSVGYGLEMRSYFEVTLEKINILRNKESSDLSEVYYYNITALGERYDGHLDHAIERYFESYAIALKIPDDDLAVRALLGVSSCLNMKGSYEEAISVLHQALKMSVSIESLPVLGDIFGIYASNLKDRGDYEGAFEAFNTALMHYENTPNYKEYVNYGVIIGNIALTYIELKQHDKADDYINQLMTLVDNDEFLLIAQGAIEVIADSYANREDYYNAHHFRKMLLKAKSNQTIQFFKNSKISDSGIVSQIEAVESLRQANRQLTNENAFLHVEISKEFTMSPEKAEIIKRVGEGLRNDAFIPYFQAVWKADLSECTGYEVLARWRQPDGKDLSPASFIDIIEESPLIVDLSEQIVRKALRQFGVFMKQNRETQRRISFNIAPYQLVNQDLVRFFKATCLEFSVPRNNVTIEITERTFIDNNLIAINQLHALKDAGFNLALDDFGTGYSSLASIAELPIDVVKIDRGLIREIANGGKAYQLLKGIIYIIKSLGLRSVAEGIESEDQLKVLKSIGCEQIQGFLLHRPSPEISERS